jgi:hypothetical protein
VNLALRLNELLDRSYRGRQRKAKEKPRLTFFTMNLDE